MILAMILTMIISTHMAKAGTWSPASSILTIATVAGVVSDELARKITADTVAIELAKKYMAISMIAGRQTGIVTLHKENPESIAHGFGNNFEFII